MVLFFLAGIGTKSYGQAAGDYVFTQASDTLWATTANWSTSDGAGGLTVATRTPGATDNVWIPADKRMSIISATSSGTGSFVAGSTTVTLATAPTVDIVGLAIRNKVQNGANYGFAAGTYVTAVSGSTVTISQPTTSAGSSIALEFYPSCKNLTVNGSFIASAQLVVFGDITVNTGGIFTQASDLYCANINNYGTFKATTNFGSAKNLYFGYVGAAPGAGDYTIINDGTFGDSKTIVPAGTGSGIRVIYSNQANSVTVKPSTPTTTGYAFNIAQLLPTGYIKTTANTNLYIKESMSLLLRNGIGFSIQNNDTCPGTIRTCTIDPGVTVYLGYRFHSNGNVTTNDQGSFVYNLYGTLDMGTYASASNNTNPSASNVTDFGLCMSTTAGNAGKITFNVGDGTQANAGTLILGSNVKLIKQATQTIEINLKDYSTVVVAGNYGTAMNYQFQNDNAPAPFLFPKNYYNLTVNGAGVMLPVAPVVAGTKTYTSGAYGTANWVAATTATQGSILYTGANYYYVPVVKTTSTYSNGTNPITLAGDTVLQYIKVGQSAAGSSLTATVSDITGNSVTLSAAPTPNSTQTNTYVTFTGKSDATTAPTGTSSNVYQPVVDGTQCLIYLGGADFATAAGYVVNGVNTPDASNVLVYSNERNKLTISNSTEGDIANVYSINGIKVASAQLTGNMTTISIPTGIYLVKINASVSKVVVR